ncbi:hypothetical protein GCM10010116_34520 [Microbispora rosea subsp. aerata]|nr:hypothetical protein GCM10010116_34520 [Microbispora rosea subsp. aerata]GIH55936.1 hypothetical protein Mro02_28500 [Microbispora rosea subsp. aerata]GLJ81838.1 hypothetical protein GCM10017588_05630 [Microbispora rosea subsp. aerata]
MHREGIEVARCTVARLMRELGPDLAHVSAGRLVIVQFPTYAPASTPPKASCPLLKRGALANLADDLPQLVRVIEHALNKIRYPGQNISWARCPPIRMDPPRRP